MPNPVKELPSVASIEKDFTERVYHDGKPS